MKSLLIFILLSLAGTSWAQSAALEGFVEVNPTTLVMGSNIFPYSNPSSDADAKRKNGFITECVDRSPSQWPCDLATLVANGYVERARLYLDQRGWVRRLEILKHVP